MGNVYVAAFILSFINFYFVVGADHGPIFLWKSHDNDNYDEEDRYDESKYNAMLTFRAFDVLFAWWVPIFVYHLHFEEFEEKNDVNAIILEAPDVH
jgi:hypothetical protein